MRLKGLTAVVTGATSGIGRAIAVLFANEGASIAVVGRNAERGKQVVDDIAASGGTAYFFQTDVTDEKAVNASIDQIVQRFGAINILVNNAGLVIPGTIPETSKDDWDQVWQTNVTSIYLMSHAVIPHMVENKDGAIINISSEAGVKGLKARAAYCAAKFAVVGLTKAMAVDHSGDGVRVNCLCPGTVETEMVSNIINQSTDPDATRQMLVERRLTPFIGSADDIARAALFLADPQNRYTTGAVLSVDGGASAK